MGAHAGTLTPSPTLSARWSIALCLLLSLLGCSRGDSPSVSENLLAGLPPSHASGALQVQRLTDGVAVVNGDSFSSELTSRLRGSGANVTYDLGAPRSITAVWLQADHNDTYVIEVSDDATTFRHVWSAMPVSQTGMQDRQGVGLNAAGRYVRVWPTGGDGTYTLSELQVFSEPQVFPPAVPRLHGMRSDVDLRTRTMLFGLALLAFVYGTFRGSRRWWLVLVSLVPLWAGIDWLVAVRDSWPVEQRQISMLRATVALVAALAVAREVFAPKRLPAHRGAVLATLATCGVLGVAAFYNLGHPQFWDSQRERSTYVHLLDLRQYYATAKYFPEIGYRGLYAADVAAYLDDAPGVTLASLASKPMRDLDTLQNSSVGAQRREIETIKQRFTPERWQAYKNDQRYLRETMGLPLYLEMMVDLGGNATPVWITILHFLFSLSDASDTAFLITGALDPLMLVLALIAIGFTFGPRTAFVCMVLFGANDFIMYFTNWGGATLRHDWMAYLAFGACALRREWWMLGGAFLALASLIRAFPALSLLALALPVLWYVIDTYCERTKVPGIRELLARHRPVLRVALGASITVLAGFALSSAVLGVDAWSDWHAKVGQLQADPHANHISLRSLVAGWEADQAGILQNRRSLFAAASAFFVAMVVLGARHKRLEQVAMLGMILMPVFFYPANYYIHFVWLLPLIVIERHGATRDAAGRPLTAYEGWVWIALLLMCAAQYWTTFVTVLGLHFYLASVCLFSALSVVLIVYVRGDSADLERLCWKDENQGVVADLPRSSLAGVVPASAQPERPDADFTEARRP